MRPPGAMLRCAGGTAAIEFALIAPAILLFLIGTIEVSRMLWTRQTLDEVAFSTARCTAVSTACATEAAQKTYAVNRAAGYGIAITNPAVTPASGVDCRGFPNSIRITIVAPVTSVLSGFIPTFPTTIDADACFPRLATA